MSGSLNLKERFKDDLINFSHSVDTLYTKLYNEISEEINGKREKSVIVEEEIKELYHNLTDEDCIRLVKHRLPLSVKLFNKITYLGRGITRTGRFLEVHFAFNDNTHSMGLQCTFTSKEIKTLLKIEGVE